MRHIPAFVFGIVIGAVAMCCVFASSLSRTPEVPQLRPPTAIKITIYPCENITNTDGLPVNIPADKLDYAYRLITPESYFKGGVHEFITRIVAEAIVTHADGTHTTVLVRDGGHNPAVVTVDGRNYFYARNDPNVHYGAIALIRLVNEARPKDKLAGQAMP